MVIFYRPKWEENEGLGKSSKKGKEKGKEKSREKIIRLISDNSTITTKEIARITGLSSAGVEKNIRILKQQKRLRRIGPDKGGHWKVSS